MGAFWFKSYTTRVRLAVTAPRGCVWFDRFAQRVRLVDPLIECLKGAFGCSNLAPQVSLVGLGYVWLSYAD
nr:hypothetical protein [Tanacetum cinerariifolium]